MADKTNIGRDSSEQSVLAELKQGANIPTLPAVAQKLVVLCNDEDANFADFARVIEADPGLASRILKVANSAYYGLRNKATNLDRAITALGLKYVKSIALGFQLATAFNKCDDDTFSMEKFWEESVLRAVIARQLASQYCAQYREEAFLIGLLQDCGIPVLASVFGSQYSGLWREISGSQASITSLEREAFQFDHQQAAAAVAEVWGLPDVLAMPMQMHHQRENTDTNNSQIVRLHDVAYFSGTLSLNNPESVSQEDLEFSEYSQRVFGLDAEGLKKLLQKVKQEFSSVSQMFSNILPDQLNVGELLSQANGLLSRLASEPPQEVFNLEKEIQKLNVRCETLSQDANEYRQQAETDALTGLSTRHSLESYLQEASDCVKSGKGPLMVLFIDLDDFKGVNDTFGHATGDLFLTTLSQLLQTLFGQKGCVARYGGDEMIVALQGPNLKQAITLCKVLLGRIRAAEIKTDYQGTQHTLGLSCSIGLSFFEAGSQPGHFSHILELADNQMYQAKQGGKNEFCYGIISANNTEQPATKN